MIAILERTLKNDKINVETIEEVLAKVDYVHLPSLSEYVQLGVKYDYQAIEDICTDFEGKLSIILAETGRQIYFKDLDDLDKIKIGYTTYYVLKCDRDVRGIDKLLTKF